MRAFCAWLERHGAPDLTDVEPVHVAAYVEQLGRTHARPSVALRLAAIKRLFAFLVTGGALRRSPAVEVKGPSFSRRVGATPATSTEEVRKLLDRLPADGLIGLRDRALIGAGGHPGMPVEARLVFMSSAPWFNQVQMRNLRIDCPLASEKLSDLTP